MSISLVAQKHIDLVLVDRLKFPDEVLIKLKGLSDQVVAEVAEKDPMSKKVYDSFRKFRDQAIAWHNVSERAYLNARSL